MQAIQELYQCTTDWDLALYCGITLNWDYNERPVELSMPGCVPNKLHEHQHPAPYRPEHAPHKWLKPTYGRAPQLATPEDTSEKLDAAGKKKVQEVVGSFGYYARAIDLTMLVALGTLASAQADPTKDTELALTQFLNYAATHPDACIKYYASDMILDIQSDASYLSERGARSRAGGHFHLTNNSTNPLARPKPDDPMPMQNGALHTLSTIMKMVLGSAAEAKLAALYFNCQEGCHLRIMLEELGHPQPPTGVQTDNSTAQGICNKTVKQRRTKGIDMRFYWLQDRDAQAQFLFHWKRGDLNKRADYVTKHHSPTVHKELRSTVLHVKHPASSARVC
jgi:hypothetical protein